MIINDIIRNIRIGLGLLSKIEGKRKCPKCGYEPTDTELFTICKDCIDRFSSMSLKKKRKVLKKFKENPFYCPVCGRKRKSPIGTRIGTCVCKECGTLYKC